MLQDLGESLPREYRILWLLENSKTEGGPLVKVKASWDNSISNHISITKSSNIFNLGS